MTQESMTFDNESPGSGELVEGSTVRIIDDSYLPGEYARMHSHYKNGTIATVKGLFYGFVELEAGPTVSTISLSHENLKAIEVIS